MKVFDQVPQDPFLGIRNLLRSLEPFFMLLMNIYIYIYVCDILCVRFLIFLYMIGFYTYFEGWLVGDLRAWARGAT